MFEPPVAAAVAAAAAAAAAATAAAALSFLFVPLIRHAGSGLCTDLPYCRALYILSHALLYALCLVDLNLTVRSLLLPLLFLLLHPVCYARSLFFSAPWPLCLRLPGTWNASLVTSMSVRFAASVFFIF